MRKHLTHLYGKAMVILELSSEQIKKISDIAAEIGTLIVLATVIPFTANNFSLPKAVVGLITTFTFWIISLALIRYNINK